MLIVTSENMDSLGNIEIREEQWRSGNPPPLENLVNRQLQHREEN